MAKEKIRNMTVKINCVSPTSYSPVPYLKTLIYEEKDPSLNLNLVSVFGDDRKELSENIQKSNANFFTKSFLLVRNNNQSSSSSSSASLSAPISQDYSINSLSATKIRKLASDGNSEIFRDIYKEWLDDKDIEQLYNYINTNKNNVIHTLKLDISEILANEKLTEKKKLELEK